MFKDYKIAYIEKNVKIKEKKPMNFVRQGVAYMLTHSANTIPHAAMITQYDVTPVLEYTKASEKTITRRDNETPEQFRLRRAVRKNLSAFFLKVMAHTLANSGLPAFLDYRTWRGPGTLYYTDEVNMSYTVNTNYGVIKPIVRNAHEKTIVEVATEMRELTRKARRTDPNELYRRLAVEYVKCALCELNFKDIKVLWMLLRSLLWMRDPVDPELADVPEEQKLKPSDLLGATATLANNGMVVAGNQTQTIITPPELFMFGVSDLHQAALVVDGQIVPRWVITLFATMDHRALDAGEGFPFFARTAYFFKHPEKIYEWEHGMPDPAEDVRLR